jgi:hypothetical protein
MMSRARHFEVFRGLMLIGCLMLAACDNGPTAPVANQITIAGGDNQVGVPSAWFPNPLAVRVTGAGNRGVPNVKVYWQIASGVGSLGSFPLAQPLTQSFTFTDADGVARVFVQLPVIGTSLVAASIAELPDRAVAFTATVRAPVQAPALVFSFGPMFDCTPFTDPSIFGVTSGASDGTIPVGAKVEWTYAPWLSGSCRARITSISVPPGGEPFDSGIISAGESFQFVPRVAGTWEYVDALNGGRGTFTAKAP